MKDWCGIGPADDRPRPGGCVDAYSGYCVVKSFAASNTYMTAVHDLIPGGAHTYAKGDDQYPDGMAPVIERGTGCRVWDIDGNEYVEFGSGLRSNLLGHGFEPVVRAVRGWLEDGVNFVRPHRIELEAAERLVELIPSAEMVKFGLNGSDATTAAVRLARAYTGREMVAVCRDQPFFSTDDWFIVTTPMSAGIPEAARRLTVQFSYNDLADLGRLFDTYPGQIAAVIMEAETVQPPAPGYFDGLRRLCDRNGVLLILDEMITGFRWHERGAQFVYGIEADLCTFGKGMANGFPVSALVGRRDVMRLGGFVDDADRVSCCLRPRERSRGRWRPCWPSSTAASGNRSPSDFTKSAASCGAASKRSLPRPA